MDIPAVLAAFDEQVRRSADGAHNPEPDRVDAPRVLVTTGSTWSAVLWSRLTEQDADEVIASRAIGFADLADDRGWEWKYYSYDTPADLPERLRAAGLVPEEPETLMVADLHELGLNNPDAAKMAFTAPPELGLNDPDPAKMASTGPPELDPNEPDPAEIALTGTAYRVRIEPVVDAAGVDAMVAVRAQVFGGDQRAWGDAVLDRLGSDPDSLAAFVVVADGRPVSTGRVDFHPGTEFASIWGGSTVPQWRRRGLFRALVSHRARLALDQGYRYLQVDAAAMSRPILRRMGFHELATTIPFIRRT